KLSPRAHVAYNVRHLSFARNQSSPGAFMSTSYECASCKQFFVVEESRGAPAACPRCGRLCTSVTATNMETAVRPRLGVLVGAPPADEPRPPAARQGPAPLVPPRYARAEWSVLALTLGLTALAITWPLRAWQVGMALSGLGALMAIAAFLVACLRKQASLELPSVALVVNALAVIMAIVLTRTPEPGETRVEVPVVRVQTLGDLRGALASPDPEVRAKTLAKLRDAARDLDAFKADLLAALY